MLCCWLLTSRAVLPEIPSKNVGRGEKINRDSPLHDVCTDKRPCLNDSDVTDTDADATIISSQETISSTVMDIPPAFFHKQASYSNVVKSPNPGSLELRQILREELKSMFSDPVFLEAQSKALASELKREIEELKQQVKESDAAIASLRAKVDDLEQYTRRNSVRIMGIPETSNEDTDKITIAIAKRIGAEIDIDQIDRSHRVGLKKDGGARPIIVKFTSYRAKAERTSNKRKLASQC